jgi:hypothetical protein
MSRGDVARYRVPPVREHSRRTLAEHLTVRFQALARLYGSALIRLPLDSRLRREMLARGVRDSAEAWNRRDRDAFLAAFDPEAEINFVGGAPVGVEDRYRGREGALRWIATIDEAWESNRLEPQGLIDFGDRFLVLHHNRARGRGSGVELTTTSASS